MFTTDHIPMYNIVYHIIHCLSMYNLKLQTLPAYLMFCCEVLVLHIQKAETFNTHAVSVLPPLTHTNVTVLVLP